MDGQYTGFVPRIERGDTAIIFLRENGRSVETIEVPIEALPPDARHAGAVLQIRVANGAFVDGTYLLSDTVDRLGPLPGCWIRKTRPPCSSGEVGPELNAG